MRPPWPPEPTDEQADAVEREPNTEEEGCDNCDDTRGITRASDSILLARILLLAADDVVPFTLLVDTVSSGRV